MELMLFIFYVGLIAGCSCFQKLKDEIIIIIINYVTSRNTGHIEKPVVSQLFNKFPALHGHVPAYAQSPWRL